MYKKHQEAQTYLNTIKQIWDEALREWKSVEEIQEDIANICTKCLMPPSEECEMCLWNTTVEETKEDIYKELEFEEKYS